MFVTGVGLVTPHGDDPSEVFRRLCAGESAFRKCRFEEPGRETELILARTEWDPGSELTALQMVAMDPAAQVGYAAGRRALEHSGILDRPDLLRAAGLYFGASFGGHTLSDSLGVFYGRKSRRYKPTTVARTMPNATAAHLSMANGMEGPACTYSVSCASSGTAIGEAYRAIRDGYLDCVVAGGTQSALADALLGGWEAMSVLATEHPDGPAASVRPFDRARTGFGLGEGAAVLVLECETQVEARGAEPLAEIIGYGASSDAFSLTQPAKGGQVRSMAAALTDAGVPPEAVGYVNAHATGTKVGDVVECSAIREVFGDHAATLPVSSTKSMHGHLVEAAGALEFTIAVLALVHQRIPPTANLTDPDPECDVALVRGTSLQIPDLDVVLSNSFGFGGSNVSLLARRVS